MKKIRVCFIAFISMFLSGAVFAVPSSMVYTARMVKPGGGSADVFDKPTLKTLNVSIKNGKDETVWAVKNAQVLVAKNGIFTLVLNDEMPGVESGGKSLEKICVDGEASQIVTEIPGSTYMAREEFVTTPLVDRALAAKKFASAGDAFVLSNLEATEINVSGEAEISNMVVSNSLSSTASASLDVGGIDYSRINSMTVKSSNAAAKASVFDSSCFRPVNNAAIRKEYNEKYSFESTLLISATNSSAKVYTKGKKSGMLLISNSHKFPGVVIPFSGEDIYWPFAPYANDTLDMHFFPFGSH